MFLCNDKLFGFFQLLIYLFIYFCYLLIYLRHVVCFFPLSTVLLSLCTVSMDVDERQLIIC